MADGSNSRFVVLAALGGNLAIACTKLVAAIITGSSSMLTEAVHSFVDTTNQMLLLYGMRRSAQPADANHPLGYGRELYFWSFVVALLIFAGGAGVSVYEGIVHIRDPEPIRQPMVNYVVLAIAFLFEGISWSVALRDFRRAKGPLGYWQAIRRSKDPPTFVVLFEDSAALIGIIIAAAAIATSQWLDDPRIDGIGSILIGVLLGGVAMVLAKESKGLLIGERARPELAADIRRIAGQEPGICRVNDVMTVHLAPDQIVVAISLDFDDDLDTGGIERLVASIERKIRAAHDDVTRLFVKPQAAGTLRSP